ncbi:hypothetical protein MCOR27_008689 [Pyricularia oryzae]|uniref:Uncharacterized protein n=5 Tax=Pyricularia TaxID=48558 RepID=A0ABQ8N8G9_PYRGI|nr:uncharacterized protein MGG_04828 [Pyricularia oryzae 70-15]ELQ42704.1 hypothetical protein OOU_Y34scaffold00194g16 [Pyricularia oryzae Y34]KAH8837322.1 hypothetical protein MCOR01_010954 [Pyricularia oryzae]KAI6292996.1 hypothetical protein MCOR33_009450 [Pyricularia grisea]EHA53950.1 hypothetical protein MGG_04828 [Pyricularia oryzae 70-15]KAH9438001.1 hypothetical protein MCOR02_001640 [Pyricularia oryzae]
MRRPESRLVATIASLLSAAWMCRPVAGLPMEAVDAGYGYLEVRDCANPCGMDSQYCCGSGERCFTSNGLAGCTAAAGGGFALFTTTWTQTQTFTSTGSTYFPAATTQAPNDCIVPPGSGWTSCGSICCASNQYCAQKNQCMAKGAGGGGIIWTTSTYTSDGQVKTTQFSAPYRVTGSGGATGTAIPGATGTADNQNGEEGGGGGGGLTAGQIAGIVIGVIAAVVILIVICACCIVRGLCLGVMGLLGLGGKKDSRKSEKTVVEERYVRRGASRGTSAHTGRDRHSGWFSGSGRPSTVTSRKEKKDSGAGWLGLAGAAGTILLLLGLKKNEDKKKKTQVVEERRRSSRRPRSEVSASTWDSYTSYTDPSSVGTRRTSRTRDTRRTVRTETRSRAASRR